ncbi:tetratricopeptide repeat protein [Corynebacterium sp. zg912]|uniref:Tetratricopeptide repeat protein n=1 Tax=Corynebacterium wankanglinii TaxID=2735136 RepID=A0A7H0K7W5_9CORY|nr:MULTISPECIES: tetratricopeptide repeat protein [Corynebacterium]MBA1837570.1 tetratricopeptide repeat protein [Corynebacterium wankanglinii]MCR5928974.1 tetratricopeptide repeat protein [Corynebacterium sp. zg912]QNP93381.1 tetratricopeptide repeat protein [Corynebacterium wankanglinii]
MTNPQFTGGAIDLGALVDRNGAGSAGKEQGSSGFEPFISVDEASVEQQVFERSMQIPVVMLIGTSRSTDSESLKAQFEKLSAGQRSFMVAYLDADTAPQVAQAMGVRVLPTVVALAGGRPVANFEGNQPANELEQWVGALVSQIGPQLQGLPDDGVPEAPAEDPRLDQATEALNAGDFDRATAVYDEILADDPANADIKQAKATVAVLKRVQGQGEPEDDVDRQLHLADREFVADDPEAAFDRLLRLVKAEPRAKERLLELLSLLEPGDPRVIAARTRLASTLF